MNANYDPDIGGKCSSSPFTFHHFHCCETDTFNSSIGSRGYALGFTDHNSYASVANYFTPSNHWAVNEQTFSLWLRWVGMPNNGESWVIDVIAANDPTFIELGFNVGQIQNNCLGNLELYIAQSTMFTPVTNPDLIAASWTHVTITLNSTGFAFILLS